MADLIKKYMNENQDYSGLEDCIYLLESGNYEILTCSENHEKYIFPITTPEEIVVGGTGKQETETWRDLVIPDIYTTGHFEWVKTDDFLLNMKRPILPDNHKYNHVGRFSYNPDTLEFLPSTIDTPHRNSILKNGSSPFNHYVRGIYIKPINLVLIRPYFNPLDENGNFDPSKSYSNKEDQVYTEKTINMLLINGLPLGSRIISRANNELIQQLSYYV